MAPATNPAALDNALTLLRSLAARAVDGRISGGVMLNGAHLLSSCEKIEIDGDAVAVTFWTGKNTRGWTLAAATVTVHPWQGVLLFSESRKVGGNRARREQTNAALDRCERFMSALELVAESAE
jgi:hypothetical protein